MCDNDVGDASKIDVAMCSHDGHFVEDDAAGPGSVTMVSFLTFALATHFCYNGTRQSWSMSLSWTAAVDGLRGVF